MSKTVRAKFTVTGVDVKGTITNVSLWPVYSADPESENKQWNDATPAGSIHLGITSTKEAASFFVPGEEVLVDFSKAN